MLHDASTNTTMLMLVLDIETTGLSRTEHKITVIGTIVYESSDETIVSQKCYNVAVAEACKCKKDLIAMKEEVSGLLNDAASIVAFNGVNFDMPFIRRWLRTTPACLTSLSQIDNPTDSDIKPVEPNDSLGKRKISEFLENNVQTTSYDVSIDTNGNEDSSQDPWKHKYLDFCRLSREYTGSYISLHNVCLLNKIDVAKSGSGAQAVQWALEKNWPLLESYCMQDVIVLLALTKPALRAGITLRLGAYGKRQAHCDTVNVSFDSSIRPFVTAAPGNGAVSHDIFNSASPNVLKLDDRQTSPDMEK